VVRIDELKQALQMHTRYSFRQTPLRLALAAFAFGAAILSGHARAAVGTATASATVLEPVAVSKTADLSFGKFGIGAGGTITISTSGVRTASGVVPSADGSTITAATFVVTGSKDATFSITHGGTTSLSRTSGSETMALTKFSDLTAANAISGNATSGTLTSGTQPIYVGGTLTVAANQAAGDYTGLVSIAVEYN
jgi:hypothetical protein